MAKLTAAIRSFDNLRKEAEDDEHRIAPARERWPHVSGHRNARSWWCEDCVRTGPVVFNATPEQLDEIESDYVRHSQTPEHIAKVGAP